MKKIEFEISPYLGKKLKLLLIMKLTFLLTVVCFLQTSATVYSQATKFSFEMKNQRIQDVLREIEQNSDFRFFYQREQVDVEQIVTMNVTDKTVEEILPELFKGQEVVFDVRQDNLILIKPAKGAIESSTEFYAQQQNSVSGKVTDTRNQPLPGVTVVVKGTTQGTVTDVDGNYSLSTIPENATLQFSFIGMQTQEIVVGTQTIIDISLKDETIGIEEVVAIGYGTQKRATLSGSIATIDAKEITKIPVPNLTNAIAGQLPGVIVNSPGGEPGADDAEVYIRGKGTLGNSSPLIVIDGIPDRGGFSRLNSEDIESFSVLKDASAAIYGARSANGVILITTKRGKTGEPVITANANMAFSQPTTEMNLLDSWQEATLANELKLPWENPQWSNEQIQYLKDQTKPLQYPNTDWENLLLKDWTMTQNYNLSARGGNENFKYFVSGQYLKQDGVFKGTGYPFNQFSLRTNLDAKLTKTLTLGLDLLNRREERNYWAGGNGRDGYNTPWNYARRGGRYLVGYFPDGRVGKGWQPGEFNAAESVSSNGGFTEILDNIVNTKMTLTWETPVKGLIYSMYGAYDSRSNSYSSFKNIWDEWLYDYDTDTYTKAVDATKRTLDETKSVYETTVFNAKLAYQRSFGDHNIDAFAAYEQSKYEMSYLFASRVGLPSDKLPELFTGESAGQNNNGYSDAYGRINYFGRINYDYKGKYIATISLRHDGSQNFPPEKRYGTFPSISMAWRLSEEPFMENVTAITNLKLRGSWGQMGNDDVAPFQYLTSYRFTDYTAYGWGVLAGYDFGNGTLPGIFEAGIANPNITWETATTSDIGLEGNLFENMLRFEFDYFNSKREDILIARNASVPEYTGLVLPDENLGKVNNSGIELLLTHQNKINQDLSYFVSGNMSYAHNEVQYYDEPAGVLDYQKYEGRPIDSWLLYEAVKIYETQDEIDNSVHGDNNVTMPGDIWVKDLNNDGKINTLDTKRIEYGRIPEIMYGINMGVTYKSFDFSMLFQGQAHAYVSLYSPMADDKLFFENRWENGTSIYPRINGASYSTGGYGDNSTFWLRKADFLRLKNVSLSYNVPKKILNSMKLSDVQLYLRGNNLFLLFDDIEGNWQDPEGSSIYPNQRSWQIGLKINL